jgi:hypothetical protein
MAIVTPLVGATTNQIWKPVNGVTNPVTVADATAPFALATRGQTDNTSYGVAQFCRVVTAQIPNANGTTPIGITAGVTAAAGTGNNWYNVSGQTPIAGDYMFLVAGTATL